MALGARLSRPGLLVIATLHTGFHFGWNIHTLAYVLMCVVIASGVFGVFCYVRYPRLMTENRHGTTMPQMLGRIATLNDELRATAITVDDRTAALSSAPSRRPRSAARSGGSFRVAIRTAPPRPRWPGPPKYP